MTNTYPDASPGSQHALLVDAALRAINLHGPLTTAQLIAKLDELMPVRLFPNASKRSSRFSAILAKEKRSAHPRLDQDDRHRWRPTALPERVSAEPMPAKRSSRIRPPERLADPDAVEIMRRRLGLEPADFSEALGLARTSYHGMARDRRVPKTVALAAEALVRRQGAADVAFLVRVVRGVPQVIAVDDPEEIRIGGKRFLLLSAGAAR